MIAQGARNIKVVLGTMTIGKAGQSRRDTRVAL